MNRLRIPLAVASAILMADRASKIWVNAQITAWDVWPVIPGLVNLIHAENPGMAFSLLATAPAGVRGVVLVGLAAAVMVMVAMMLWRSEIPAERMALALVLGGAVGNLWDRVARGTVTDFIDVYYGEWHFATFNVADAAITCGALLLALLMIVPAKEAPPARAS